MDTSLLLSQFLSGLSRGMVLFLIASGLSLIFGVMNILNFAHASLWLVGAYFCYSFWVLLQGYGFGMWVSIGLAALTLAAIGWVIEVVLIRRVYDRELPEQLLLTYAMVLIIGDLIKLTWGVEDRIIARPPLVEGPVFFFGIPFDSYFIFVILVGFAVAIGLWWFLQKTKYGHIVRAAVFSREMVSALGIPIPRIYTGVFVLGIFIAGLAGGVQAPVGSITLGMDMAIVVQAFCVVVIGGFGSLLGTLVGSIIVGEIYAFSILFWPQGALVLIFVVTAVVLIIRPWGLFGTPMRA
ncbi:MAG: branched-chain amino acid ABC transporter permease [Proteobacteria bacterium]|nr:branched-chain amino acid ABC transporter permease [Pseudomonadota bacterium]NIS70407.1 branched-chain amino acid ABC transporter permease [Pseudomonadota bacterium]